jgi:hypothetical protein
MLNNYSNLANSLKDKFREINDWPEITFDSETVDRLSSLPNVKKVSRHSIQFEIEENQVVIPSQYVLFAICIKELALKLHDHLEIFEQYKQGKSTEDVGGAISNGNYDFDRMNLDEYSKNIAFSVFTEPGLNLSAKSIINGTPGNFRLRSTSDFFSSVILKIINVPDASSAILGKLIYNLCKFPQVYSHLEKTYLKELPYILKSSKIGQFVKNCIEFLIQFNNNEPSFIESSIVPNSEPSLFSIKDDNIKLTSIFKKSKSLIPPEGLMQGGKPRFFSEPVYLDADRNFVYLSSEWTYDTGSRLDLNNFNLFIEKYFPMFMVEVENGNYFLKPKQNPARSYNHSFSIDKFVEDVKKSGLVFNDSIIKRFVASLNTKPFVILTGLTGSGKTKLAQSFVKWICASESQFAIIPVGADWTNREPILGFPSGLEAERYVQPDSGALKLILDAEKDPESPYFLILDEMNLSHVERYFADFLSVMESKDCLNLYSGDSRSDGKEIIPQKIFWPDNLFIIGTVNIDESTYMFSPKVLDRANVIEFRVSREEMKKYFNNQSPVNLDYLTSDGSALAKGFLGLCHQSTSSKVLEEYQVELIKFFDELKFLGAEFGYRGASEIGRLINSLENLGVADKNEKIDIAIMQKLLPKLHGSRTKLHPVLEQLGKICLVDGNKWKDYLVENLPIEFASDDNIMYRLSFEKIVRMYKNASANGFASYAEA